MSDKLEGETVGSGVYNPVVAEVIIRGLLSGERVTNKVYLESPDVWTTGRLEDAVGAIASWLNVDLMPLVSEAYQVTEFEANHLSGVNGAQLVELPGTTIQGQNTSEPLPNNVSVAVSFKSASRGRSARGRWFLAGVPSNVVTANTIDAAWANSLLSEFGELRTQLLGVNMRQVVYSRITNGQPRPLGLAFPVTASVLADLVVDSQRRRLPGRGN